MDTKRITPVFLLFAAGAAWGFTPLLVRLAEYDGEGIAALRMLLSPLFLLLVVLPERAALWRAVCASWKRQAPVGLMAAVSTTTFALACAYTVPSHVYLLYYLYPVILIAADIHQGNSPSAKQVRLVAVALFGLAVFVSASIHHSSMFIGDVFAVFSALSWSLYIILARKNLFSSSEVISANIIGQVLGFVLFLPFVFDLICEPAQWPGTENLIWIVLFGLVSSIPLFAWAKAVHRIPGHIAGVITMVEAPIGVLLCYLVLALPLGYSELLGGALILFAAARLSMEAG